MAALGNSNSGNFPLRSYFTNKFEYGITYQRNLLQPLRPAGASRMGGRFRSKLGGFSVKSIDQAGVSVKKVSYSDNYNSYGGMQRYDVAQQVFKPTQVPAVELYTPLFQSRDGGAQANEAMAFFQANALRTWYFKYVLAKIAMTGVARGQTTADASRRNFTLDGSDMDTIKNALVTDKWLLFNRTKNTTMDESTLICYMKNSICKDLEISKDYVLPTSAAWRAVVRRSELSPVSTLRIQPTPDDIMPSNVDWFVCDDRIADMFLEVLAMEPHENPPGILGHVYDAAWISDVYISEYWANFIQVSQSAAGAVNVPNDG